MTASLPPSIVASVRQALTDLLPYTLIAAEQGLARTDNAEEQAFYRGKLQAARYFLTWEVPGCHHELAILEARDDTCLAMQDAWF